MIWTGQEGIFYFTQWSSIQKSIVNRQGAPKNKTHQWFWGLKSQVRRVLSAGKYGILSLTLLCKGNRECTGSTIEGCICCCVGDSGCPLLKLLARGKRWICSHSRSCPRIVRSSWYCPKNRSNRLSKRYWLTYGFWTIDNRRYGIHWRKQKWRFNYKKYQTITQATENIAPTKRSPRSILLYIQLRWFYLCMSR